MSRRLVIPAGAQPSDVAWPGHRPETWQQLADEAGVDGIEVLGSQWCQANGINGLGIATEAPPPPPPGTPWIDPLTVLSAVKATAASAVTADVRAIGNTIASEGI